MHETEYRASRVCRVFGNPTAYGIIKALLKKDMSPSMLAETLGKSLPLISATLRTLRNVDVVRYETRGNVKMYCAKDKTVADVCHALERFVDRMRRKNY